MRTNREECPWSTSTDDIALRTSTTGRAREVNVSSNNERVPVAVWMTSGSSFQLQHRKTMATACSFPTFFHSLRLAVLVGAIKRSHAFVNTGELGAPRPFLRSDASFVRQGVRETTSTRRFFFNFLGSPPQDEEPAPPSVDAEKPDSNDEPDLVEKIFGVFFGQKEETPFGLKRFGQDRFPEQYPATVTEWAEPVAGDDKEVAKLRPLLKNTNLESRLLRLVYSANSHGWRPDAFHAKVDRGGPSLVVCTTTSGQVFGGYNPKGWVSYGEARGSIAAFLFVQSNSESGWTKLRKVGGPSLAQLDYPEAGPSFGADSLVIPLASANPKLVRSKLGSYFERFPDGSNTLFSSSQSSAQLREFKVYQGVYAPDEYVPFTDAEPFALY